MEQGCSRITETKEIQIKGTIKMRLLQRKNQQYINKIAIFDVFSGDGANIIDGKSIDGSPIEIIDAINTSRIFDTKEVFFVASDKRKVAISSLLDRIVSFKDSLNSDSFRIDVMPNSADQQLCIVEKFLRNSEQNHAILVIDPNGPGTLPFDQINELSKYNQQLDVIINISESTIKRIKANRITKNCNWWAEFDTFEDILFELFSHYREGWIRDTIKGDNQRWRLITLWSWSPPRNAWEKQRLYRIQSKQDIHKILSGGM